MVVNRKQPVAPAPPISRTSSSQPVPSKKQTKVSKAVNEVESKSAANGHTSKSSNSKAQGSSADKVARATKTRKSRSLIDRIFLLALTSFALYSFYTCRPNPLFSQPSLYTVEPALCRSLSTYRKHILEPYLLPPLKHTLTFTQQVSEPYIAEARTQLGPYLEPVHHTIDTVSPYVKSALHSGKKIWQDTLIPFYSDTLKPYYDTAIVPRYNRYIKPRLIPLQAKVERYSTHYISHPIRAKTNLILLQLHQVYISKLDPYVRAAKPHTQRVWTSVSDLAHGTCHSYQTYLHPWVAKAWVQIRPYACSAWKQIKVFLIRVLEVTGVALSRATTEAGVYRREYVDPHIRRIWDKVVDPKEAHLSGKVTPVATASTMPLANDLPDTTEEDLTVAAVPEPTSSVVHSIPSSSSIIATPSKPKSAAATPEVTPVLQATTSAPASESSATHVPVPPKIGAYDDDETPRLPETKVDQIPSVVGSPGSTVAAEAGEIETATDDISTSAASASETAVPATETTEDVASPPKEPEIIPQTTLLTEPVPEDNLDDFLNELGVGDAPQQSAVHEENDEDFLQDPAPPQPTLTEAERLAKVAEKRADIVTRHDAWFGKLHAAIAEKGPELVKTLQKMRDEAAAEVRRLGSETATKSEGKEAAKDPRFLSDVQQDGERLIKGLEGYLKKAEGRSVDWKVEVGAARDTDMERIKEYLVKKEKDKFNDLSQKVETKFEEKVIGMKKAVHEWYGALKDREAQIVLGTAAEVHSIATKGQEDLGMDYAWLDDVTYLDWQKYHDLMRLSQNFDETVRMIANGTSTDPVPPSDPVVDALDDLEKELGDVTSGFAHSLTKALARGIAIFSLRPASEAGEEGFFAVRDGQKRKDDLRGVDLGKVGLKKEAVGTIPLKDGKTVDGNKGVQEEPGMIGTMPIPPPPVETPADETAFDASKVIIQKDKVQIEQALKDVPMEPAARRHEEL